MSLSDDLKAAIRNSGLSLTRIAREAGVAQPGLSRFMSDDPEQHRDIRLEITADKLAEYFGLTLQPASQTRRTKSEGAKNAKR